MEILRNKEGTEMKKRCIGIFLVLCLVFSVSTTPAKATKKVPNLDCSKRLIVLFAEIEDDGSKIITMGHLDNTTKLVKVKHIVGKKVTKYKPIHDVYVRADALHYYKIYLPSFKGVRKGYWVLKYKNGERIKMKITKGY